MTKTKTWLSIFTIAGVFGLGIFAIQPTAFADDDDEGIPQIEEAEVKIKKNFLKATIETEDDIPKDGSAGLFGYAILTSGLNNVLAMTTHECASDSLVQKDAPDSECPNGVVGVLTALGLGINEEHDDATWHPHILDLQVPTVGGFCESIGSDLEVNIGSSLATNNISPTDYKLKVKGDTLKVKAPLGGGDVIPDGSGIGVVSFEIGADADAAGTITDLCVLNVTPFTGDDDDDDDDDDDEDEED